MFVLWLILIWVDGLFLFSMKAEMKCFDGDFELRYEWVFILFPMKGGNFVFDFEMGVFFGQVFRCAIHWVVELDLEWVPC